jgi:hypothetical protein
MRSGPARMEAGEPPKIYPIDQSGLETYAGLWKEIVAQVSDSTGKEWVSKRVRRGKPPSWAPTPTRTRS